MKLIDLTHSFTNTMPVFPGDPPAQLTQVASIEKNGYNDHQLKTYMHVGTHMDAPLHMISKGKMMDQISIEKFIGPGVVIDARGKEKIDAALVNLIIIKQGSIILVYTGFGSQYRNKSYYDNNPIITEDFAKKMVELKVKIVGMDILGPDLPPFPVHKLLLSNEILIIENLTNLDQLLHIKNFEVIALPIKVHADAAPVRIIARILDK